MLSVNPDPVVVERLLLSGRLACPDCGEALAPWGHVPGRFVRDGPERVERVRPRRAICSGDDGCDRSHVLLPRTLLGRRVDAVSAIWAALAAHAAGLGWRKITERVGRVPGSSPPEPPPGARC